MSDQKISANPSAPYGDLPACFRVGDWDADARTGELKDRDRLERLEPKTMELLRLFAGRPFQVLSREQILAAVWPDVVVTDDALARAMFKLRRALGDDAKAARYIETLPKRGYRLVASVRALAPAGVSGSEPPCSDLQEKGAGSDSMSSPIHRKPRRRWWLGAIIAVPVAMMLGLAFREVRAPGPSAESEGSALIERADDFYYRYSRADNEAAIELYDRILAREPDRVAALRGLANALTQRMIRWPSTPSGAAESFTTLTDSLRDGHLQEPAARRILERAELLARHAISLDPSDSLSHRALGLVLATQSRPAEAITAYRAAIALDADAWGALINLSEALDMTGKPDEAITTLIAAHEAMTRSYAREKQHILPYYTDLAVLIGNRLVAAGKSIEGETWYRRALTQSPLHPAATLALARLLDDGGRTGEARQLCVEVNARVGDQVGCNAILGRQKETAAPPDSGH
ncbi:MAG: winged helix-turn-helix domain-containing protein [Dokdonella sp.]